MPKISTPTLRNNTWLFSRLSSIWTKHFPEMEQTNPVQIKFGRYSKYRLGSIKLNRRTNRSHITITAMFKKISIPAQVVDHTLAHELVHYAHGFSSKRARLHKYPHAGGVVQKEMEQRGMGYLNKAYREWVQKYRKQLFADAR